MFLSAMYRDQLSSETQAYIVFSSLMNVVDIVATFHTGYVEKETNTIVLVRKEIKRYITELSRINIYVEN